MVVGPYTTGGADAATRAERLAALNRAALALFRRGHVPVIGVNMALPVIAVARGVMGEEPPPRPSPATEKQDPFDEIMMPLSLALAERCDRCLRVAGPSAGADAEAARFAAAGKPVWHSLDEVPPCP
ncbi:MAG TPA: hypothetical protein VD970_18970 [Acetobacteraceae bacterium]|nr:hypothetical protein [Acetobacteraceae bacterium]